MFFFRFGLIVEYVIFCVQCILIICISNIKKDAQFIICADCICIFEHSKSWNP